MSAKKKMPPVDMDDVACVKGLKRTQNDAVLFKLPVQRQRMAKAMLNKPQTF
jgi:hypothetical protein